MSRTHAAGPVSKGFSRLAPGLLLLLLWVAGGEFASAHEGRLKVFVLAGQSNMQGHAKVSTFDAMRLDPATAPLLKAMRAEDGSARICERTWISSIGSSEQEKIGPLTAGYGAEARGPKIGPEFTFGLYVEQLVTGPVLIIKTAWGGKSLNTDFRPPSAAPYEFNESQRANFEKQSKDLAQMQAEKAQQSGHYYRLMMEHVRKVLADPGRVHPDYDPEAGYELAGFVWFQGWNDMVDGSTYPQRGKPGGYGSYSTLMAQFIRDVRRDLEAPALPFVIGVMGVGGPTALYGPDQQRYLGVHQGFRDAMAAPASLPEFKGNVAAVLTEKAWDQQVVALRAREKPIKQEQKRLAETGELSKEQQKAKVEALYTETFDPVELEVLRTSTSNAEYHYLGSARILAPIGKAFAEAWVELAREMEGG